MECPSCIFHNIPGSAACVRCGTRLDLAAVDFIPPRAARGRTGRRVTAASDTTRYRVAAGWADIGRSLRLPAGIGITWGQALQAIVPGLPQIRTNSRGLRFLGRAVLSLWCLVLLLALAFVGSGFGTLLGYAAVSIHCFSITLMLNGALQPLSFPVRAAVGIGLYLAVLFGLYLPASNLLGNVAMVVPIQGVRKSPAMANGDVLLYTGRWLRPDRWERGDLVVAPIELAMVGNNLIQGGLNVDRIVALPGDTVRVFKSELLINGQAPAPSLSPIGDPRAMPDADFTVGPGQCAVLPSTFAWAVQVNDPRRNLGLVELVSLVPGEAILGRVIVRVRPWRRFGYPQGGPP